MARLLLAEFGSPAPMLEAVRRLREARRGGLETYTPFPVEGTSEALGLRRSRVPLIVLVAGLGGAALGFLMQHWTNAIDYPINVGGRPPSAAPSFIPITFELGVLFAALGAFFGLLFIYRFPQPWHPTQEVEAFRSATLHAFWISIELGPDEEPGPLMDLLRELGAQAVSLAGEAR